MLLHVGVPGGGIVAPSVLDGSLQPADPFLPHLPDRPRGCRLRASAPISHPVPPPCAGGPVPEVPRLPSRCVFQHWHRGRNSLSYRNAAWSHGEGSRRQLPSKTDGCLSRQLSRVTPVMPGCIAGDASMAALPPACWKGQAQRRAPDWSVPRLYPPHRYCISCRLPLLPCY